MRLSKLPTVVGSGHENHQQASSGDEVTAEAWSTGKAFDDFRVPSPRTAWPTALTAWHLGEVSDVIELGIGHSVHFAAQLQVEAPTQLAEAAYGIDGVVALQIKFSVQNSRES